MIDHPSLPDHPELIQAIVTFESLHDNIIRLSKMEAFYIQQIIDRLSLLSLVATDKDIQIMTKLFTNVLNEWLDGIEA